MLDLFNIKTHNIIQFVKIIYVVMSSFIIMWVKGGFVFGKQNGAKNPTGRVLTLEISNLEGTQFWILFVCKNE